MKHHLVNLVLSSIVFFALVGCEENSLNNPVPNEGVNKGDPLGGNTSSGTIILDQKLTDPVTVNNYYLLNGRINYSLQLTSIQNPMAVSPEYGAELHINLDAELRDELSVLQPNIWAVKSQSLERFILTENGGYTIIKTYRVAGMPGMIELNCAFTITTKGVMLDEVFLRSLIV